MAKTAKAVIETEFRDKASQGMGKFRSEMNKTERQGKVLNNQFRFMRGGLGQVGHQFQDIAVQAQMGTNAMIIFGQQGSQIASLFGPQGAMVGAVIALGAALAMGLAPKFFGATEAAKGLEDRMKTLKERFDELGDAQKALVRTQVTKLMNDNKDLIKDNQRELNDLTRITLSFNRIFFGGNEQERQQRIKELEASIENLKKENKDLAKSIDDTSTAFEKQKESLERQINTFGLAGSALRAYEIGMLAVKGAISEQEAGELLALNNTLQAKQDAADADKKREKEKKDRFNKDQKDIEKALKQQERTAQKFADTIGDGFVNAITGAMSFKDAMRNVAKSVVDDLTRMIVKKYITDQIFGVIMNATTFKPETVANPVKAAEINVPLDLPELPTDFAIPDFAPGTFGLPSNEGGGFTGMGARSGGIDGKGGFLSVLHPRETVIDHHQGQQAGNVINQTINVTTGVQQTVRAEIQNLMPQIQEAAKAAVADSRMRGGSFSKAVRGA